MAGTISQEIDRLKQNINNTLDAVVSMGGTVEPGYNSDNMAAAVYSIPHYSLKTAKNISVPASAWIPNSSSAAYPCKAAIAVSGVTRDHYPKVAFGFIEAGNGNYSTVAETYDGGVYIYAAKKPSSAIIVASLVCTLTE